MKTSYIVKCVDRDGIETFYSAGNDDLTKADAQELASDVEKDFFGSGIVVNCSVVELHNTGVKA